MAAVRVCFVTFLFAGGESAVNELLILSQVIISFALPFAVFPLVLVTSNPAKMGVFVNSGGTKAVAWSIALLIVVLDVVLLA